MADKHIQLKIHTGNGNFDELYPVTKAELVEVNGKKLSESLNEVTTQLEQTETELTTQLRQTETELTAQLAQTATKDELQQVSLAYKESYATPELLKTAYPNGDLYNHAVLSDNMIYTYRNGWISTGIQANGTGIADGTILPEHLSEKATAELSVDWFEDYTFLDYKYEGNKTTAGSFVTYVLDRPLKSGKITTLKLDTYGTKIKIKILRKLDVTRYEVISSTDLAVSGLKEYPVDIELPENGLYLGVYGDGPNGVYYNNMTSISPTPVQAYTFYSINGDATSGIYTSGGATGLKVNFGVKAEGSYISKNAKKVRGELLKLEDSIEEIDQTQPMTRLLYTFNDAWVNWLNGDKFPLALFGDSTIDGLNTEGFILNVLGTDTQSPNAFPALLQNKLREATGNQLLRIYNAGFSGKTIDWGVQNVEAEFGLHTPYTDTKMLGIGFGINDRTIYTTEIEYRNNFKKHVIDLIDWCYSKKIQPFLLTTQANIETGTRSNDPRMRTSGHIQTIANEVKKELAEIYGLEIVDMTYFTEKFIQFGSIPLPSLIPDKLHFYNGGHKFEAGVCFKYLNPQTIDINDNFQLDYATQKVVKGVPFDKLTLSYSTSNTFKLYANYTKSDVLNTLIYKVYVYIDYKKQANIKAYKSNSSSATYVSIDGKISQLDMLEKDLGFLDLGLHTLEVYTGESDLVDFKGFIVT